MAGRRRRWSAVQPVARHDQAASRTIVRCRSPASESLGMASDKQVKQRWLVGVIREQQLPDVNDRRRSRSQGQPERRACRRPWPARSSPDRSTATVGRRARHRGGRSAPLGRQLNCGHASNTATPRCGHAAESLAPEASAWSILGRGSTAAHDGAGSEPIEPARKNCALHFAPQPEGRRCQLGCHAALASDPRGVGREHLKQLARERLRPAVGVDARPDACRAAVLAGARLDQAQRAGDQLGVPVKQSRGKSNTARHRVVQIDDRPFRVRRSHLGDHADVVRIRHQQHAGNGLHRAAGAC